MLFSEQAFGRAVTFTHKSIFSVLGWLTFGALLWGRWRYGWRGRVALRWILAGTVLLFLAYLGYKFVLEIVLGLVEVPRSQLLRAPWTTSRPGPSRSRSSRCSSPRRFFSLAETATMAANRFRLKHRAQRGSLGAESASALLAQTDRLLGVVLLGNNLINAASATLRRSSRCACSARASLRSRWY